MLSVFVLVSEGDLSKDGFAPGWSTRLINGEPIDAPVKLRLVASGDPET